MSTAAVLRAIVTVDGATKAKAELVGVGAEANAVGTKGSAGLSKFGAVGGLAFAAVGLAAVKFAADSVKAYQEHQVAVAALQHSFSIMPQFAGLATKSFEDQATALQNLTGYQDEEVLAAQNVLSNFAQTGDQIKQLTPLVLDFARRTGTAVPAAAEQIGKALLGNSRALKAVGIDFHSTGDRAKDLAAIMVLLQGKVGGVAEAFGKTSTGKMDIFKAKLDDLKETIGKSLIPALDDATGALSSFTDFLGSSAFAKVSSFINLFNPMLLGLKAVKVAASALGSVFTPAIETTDKFRQGMQDLEQQIRDFGPNSAQGIAAIAALRAALEGQGIKGSALDADIQAIIADAQTLPKSIAPAVTAIANVGTAAAASGVKFVTFGDLLMNTLHMTADQFSKWKSDLTTSLNFVANALTDLAGQADLSAKDIIKAFGKQLTAMAHYRSNFENLVARNIPADMAAQLLAMGQKGAGIVAALANANDRQFARIIAKWQAAQGSASATTGAINTMYAAAQRASGNYDIIFHIKTLGSIPGGGYIGRKAEGGMVYAAGGGGYGISELTRPTYITNNVVAGEGGREFVLPANTRGASWIKDAVRQGVVEAGGFGSGQAINVYVMMDGQDVRAKISHGDALRGVRS